MHRVSLTKASKDKIPEIYSGEREVKRIGHVSQWPKFLQRAQRLFVKFLSQKYVAELQSVSQGFRTPAIPGIWISESRVCKKHPTVWGGERRAARTEGGK